MVVHGLEGLRVRCGKFFGVVRDGRCSECHRLVAVVSVDDEVSGMDRGRLLHEKTPTPMSAAKAVSAGEK